LATAFMAALFLYCQFKSKTLPVWRAAPHPVCSPGSCKPVDGRLHGLLKEIDAR